MRLSGAVVASWCAVTELVREEREERRRVGGDRRKNPRNGRRTDDPRTRQRWQRVAWLFAAYGVYLGARALPQTVKRLFQRRVAN